MIGTILKIFTVLKGLLDVFYYVREYLDARKRAAQEKLKQEREQAIDDSLKAETDEQIFESQDRIVEHRPKP